MNAFCKSLALAMVGSLLMTPLAWGQEEEEMDPLGGVIVDMQVAGGRLAKLQTDKTTQQKQKDAVDKLTALIKLLEERRGGNGSGGGNNPTDPLKDSMIVGGPGGSGPLHAARRNGNAWGQLPAHKRDQILQSMTEGFPAHYRQILERYYRRLAEEKPASELLNDPVNPLGPAAPRVGPTASPDKSPPAEKTKS
ncbi:MAG: hypothetical protein HY288_16050 [Planctomycetia bacterium]|nr:hypothetical protein [Planctomycetia bacterium]